jgi:tetratricopeptide (TPR) repeat protein
VSEGLSVYEERRARPGWGSDVSPQLIAAYELGRLRPLSSLNYGFMRPRYPEEIVLSYALASYVFEMLEANHGIAGIRALLASFKAGQPATKAFQALTGEGATALDGRFDSWFRRKFATEFGAIEGIKAEAKQGPEVIEWGGPLRDALQEGARAIAAKRWDAAVPALERARGLFPEFAGEGSAYHMLAEAHAARGETAKQRAMLQEIVSRNETSFPEHIALADMLTAEADAAAALSVLDGAVYIGPFVAALHEKLAARASGAKAYDLSIRSRQALIALQPSDRADAYYQLAKAYADAGRTADARREVLRALDVAPNFERAQDLLLQLRKPEGP